MKSETAAASGTIVKEVIINAPLSKVWKAITEQSEIQKWFLPIENFKLEKGHVFKLTGNKDGNIFIFQCRIVELENEKKFSHTWENDELKGNLLVTYELEEKDGSTKLILTHSGWETTNHPALKQEGFTEGWAYFLNNLKNNLENNG